MLKRNNIKISAVPFYQGFTIEDFINLAKKRTNVFKYLPDERDWYKDKKWLCDVLYTLETSEVQVMIDLARQNRLEREQD